MVSPGPLGSSLHLSFLSDLALQPVNGHPGESACPRLRDSCQQGTGRGVFSACWLGVGKAQLSCRTGGGVIATVLVSLIAGGDVSDFSVVHQHSSLRNQHQLQISRYLACRGYSRTSEASELAVVLFAFWHKTLADTFETRNWRTFEKKQI